MLIALTVLLVGAASGDQQVAACPDLPFYHVELTLRRGVVTISDDLTLDEVKNLYDEVGKKVPHEPLGFYTSSFHYTVWIDRPQTATCTDPVRIHVGMILDGRRIVLGQEVVAQACLRTAALAHYKRHADANDRAFMKLAAHVQHAITDPGLLLFPRTNDATPPDAEQIVRSALERELPSFDADNRDAQAAVDTPNQVKRLAEACSTPT